jgi:hypothetical protein
MNGIMDQPFEKATGREINLLNVLVMYEDLAAGQRAKFLLDRLSAQFGIEGEGRLTMKFWRFDLLNLPLALEQAAVEAAAADVIILSVNRKMELSAVDREWTTRWLDYKEDRPYLFCLVPGQERDGRAMENSLISEMRNFAGAAGVDFSSGSVETSLAGPDAVFNELQERANQMSSVLEGILHQDVNQRGHAPWRHGR